MGEQVKPHLCDDAICECRLFTTDHSHTEHYLEAARAFQQYKVTEGESE